MGSLGCPCSVHKCLNQGRMSVKGRGESQLHSGNGSPGFAKRTLTVRRVIGGVEAEAVVAGFVVVAHDGVRPERELTADRIPSPAATSSM